MSNDYLDFKPGSWTEIPTVDHLVTFYLSRLPAIRDAAEALGYAIGLHGSCRRDLDLIAAPWRDGASDAETLAHAVAQAACGIDRAGTYDWERKPAGRLATSIPICWPAWHGQAGAGHIDLSVMPTTQAPAPAPENKCRDCGSPMSHDDGEAWEGPSIGCASCGYQEPSSTAISSSPALVAEVEAAMGGLEMGNWQQYAKEGETAQACIERHRAEQDSLMRLLAQARAITCTAHDVLAERQRQVDVEGWTPEHDDEHDDGSMAAAAAAYALAGHPAVGSATAEKLWEAAGWDSCWFRPKDTRRNLVRAGALILAEIERLDRAAARERVPS